MPHVLAKSTAPFARGTLALVLLASLALGLAACGGGQKSPPTTVETAKTSPLAGIQDDTVAKIGQDPTERVRAMAEGGASFTRVDLLWSDVAPTRPKDPTNPDDPAYQWAPYDTLVDVAKANKIEVLFVVYGTPAWAADPSVTLPPEPGVTNATAIRPKDPADFGAFATAAAARFGPRGVRRWEGWNEPNVALFLYPQYAKQADGWVATSPATYSELLKRFYAGVKAAAPNAIVGGAVTAPNGDKCGAACDFAERPTRPNRIKTVDFIAALDAPGLRPPMDVVSHHPYPYSAPRESTKPNRIYLDLYNLDVLTAAVDRTYLRGKKIWLTEYGFGTEPVPQYPKSFTQQQQAEFIVDAFGRLRANPRVELSVYYFLQDHAQWKSGLRDINGVPKPGLSAFALPLAIDEVTPKAVRLLGQARAASGRSDVRVERKDGGSWSPLATAKTAADGTFSITVRPSQPLVVRAVWEGATRTGQTRTWTSPELTIPAVTGP